MFALLPDFLFLNFLSTHPTKITTSHWPPTQYIGLKVTCSIWFKARVFYFLNLVTLCATNVPQRCGLAVAMNFYQAYKLAWQSLRRVETGTKVQYSTDASKTFSHLTFKHFVELMRRRQIHTMRGHCWQLLDSASSLRSQTWCFISIRDITRIKTVNTWSFAHFLQSGLMHDYVLVILLSSITWITTYL